MNNFDTIWKLQWEWSQGIIDTKETLSTAEAYSSDVPGPFFNIAIPSVDDPEKLNLEEIKNYFGSKEFGIYLTQNLQAKGFMEFLVRKSFKFNDIEAWMYLTQNIPSQGHDQKIINVTVENFNDFYSVLSKVFKEFPGNEVYLKICRETLESKRKSIHFPDLKSEFYIIYDEDLPAAGAGMFYSKIGDFAYLHNAGTLEEYRGRGYQSALINHRVSVAKREGINNIYASVELGGKSWANFIKYGFNQVQLGLIFSK